MRKFCFFLLQLLSLDVLAVDYTFVSPVLSGSTNVGCVAASYTFTATNNNCAGPCINSQINIGALLTVTFPAGMNTTSLTGATLNGNAITVGTNNGTTITFNSPITILENTAFVIVLNGITNGPNVSGNFTISAPNNSAGISSASVGLSTVGCNFNFQLPSIGISNANGCSLSNYTFTQTNANNSNAQINTGALVTIDFPATTNASTVTTGTFGGNAITFVTKTSTQITFLTPSAVASNVAFTIVLNDVTNGNNLSGNATLTITNATSGSNLSTNYLITTTACPVVSNPNKLKYVVYDFEGYDLNATTFPYGGYRYNDITFSIQANPLAANNQIADRCLRVDWNWASGIGGWGRGMARYIDISLNDDYINFYFYNPSANNKDVTVTVAISEDDNNDNMDQSDPWDGANDLDDVWVRSVTITRQNNWQLISLPLNTFTDRNTAGNSGGTKGNGIFDAQFSAAGGSILKVAFEFSGLVSGDGAETWYMDMISFSEGSLPYGATITDLPNKDPGDYCLLGAFDANSDAGNPHLTPGAIEGIFNPLTPVNTRKICIVNQFILFALSGTTPNGYPGANIQTLINNGYTPMITWEPWFVAYGLYDGNQVTLAKINSGVYDTYIDNFADQVKTYTGTILIRLMHEMDGDWYPWCIAVNGNNAAAHTAYINAFRRFKDRFVARGATNVKWVFCSNSMPYPAHSNNFFVSAYPGDAYVDIIGTDIYNTLDVGSWKSYRFEGASSIYYLNKHFPSKPIYVCEWGCRERSGELATSETKAQWTYRMDQELQSNFSKVRAIIAFSVNKERDWRLNSTNAARDAFKTNIWEDTYYPASCNVSLNHSIINFSGLFDSNKNEIYLKLQLSYNLDEIANLKVDKSTDGINFYTIIQKNIHALENEFIDNNIYGSTNFYKVTISYIDGSNYHSEVVMVNTSSSESINLYPNPFTTHLFINDKKWYNSTFDLVISNMLGEEVYRTSHKEGVEINIPNELKAGIYIITITTTAYSKSKVYTKL